MIPYFLHVIFIWSISSSVIVSFQFSWSSVIYSFFQCRLHSHHLLSLLLQFILLQLFPMLLQIQWENFKKSSRYSFLLSHFLTTSPNTQLPAAQNSTTLDQLTHRYLHTNTTTDDSATYGYITTVHSWSYKSFFFFFSFFNVSFTNVATIQTEGTYGTSRSPARSATGFHHKTSRGREGRGWEMRKGRRGKRWKGRQL